MHDEEQIKKVWCLKSPVFSFTVAEILDMNSVGLTGGVSWKLANHLGSSLERYSILSLFKSNFSHERLINSENFYGKV